MAKQVKIGFDKVPAPVTRQFPQLQDIEGNLLYDAAGNPLLTEELGQLSAFSRASKSMSVYANNDSADRSGLAGPVPVVEQFPEISPVSSTLLGVPRAEEQLSLFSDVSTYGLDEDNWERYTFSNHGVYPNEWYTRTNPVYGNRSETAFIEETKEQALYLKSFPTQFGFSASPRWGSTGVANPSPSNQHKLYMNFIAIGKYLFKKYAAVEGYREYASRNFIDDTIRIIDVNDNEVDVGSNTFSFDASSPTLNPVFTTASDFYTVDYGPLDQTRAAFAKVEAWTAVYQKILAEEITYSPLIDPDSGTDLFTAVEKNAIFIFLSQSAVPGGSTGLERFGLLESKQSFRYQPGRVSGFTFGVRMKTPGERSSDIIEWGCSNETDEYIFQLRGVEWSIIRRSVIPLGKQLLERQGLKENDENLVFPTRLRNDQPIQFQGEKQGTHWETKIPRTSWNGDSLLGNGRSGYTISFENVTMYKIEFSWYGAIGAKFYAYVPVENGEARWILLHTFVIENGMDQPVLKNPDLKFKYLLYNTDTEYVTSPSYIYKYGSSYYIDGGDEGTVRLTSFTSDTKAFQERTPIVGLLPKNFILNSTFDEIENGKRIYPEKLSISASQAARIDIEAIEGSGFGGHFFYSPSLHNGTSQLSQQNVILQFGVSGRTLTKYDEQGNIINWTPGEHESKVIADGIYNIYVGYNENDPTQATVLRRQLNYTLAAGRISNRVKRNGETFEPIPTEIEYTTGTKKFTAKLTGYNSLAACTVPINSNRFKIHFLNPADISGGHFKDFFIGLTSKEPFVKFNDETEQNELRFRYVNELGETVDEAFNKNTEFVAEWSCNAPLFDLKDREYREQDTPFGIRFQVDPRLPRPKGGNSGIISAIKGEVRTTNYPVDSITAATEADDNLSDPNQAVNNGWYKVVFTSSAPQVVDASGTSEVGYFDVGTDVYYVSELLLETSTSKQYCYINGDPSVNVSGKSLSDIDYVQTKTVTLTSDWQLKAYSEDGSLRFTSHLWSIIRGTKFNVQPLYLVFGMHDDAKINNIYVEEIGQTSVSTFTPNYLFTQDGVNGPSISEVNVAGESNILNPAAFVSDNRLSGIRFDSTLTQPLRPGNKIYSFYVGANQPTTIDLSKVFNFDRKTLTTGLVNNTAYYITATGEIQDVLQPDGSTAEVRVGGNIEVSLTVKEQ